LFGNTLEGYQPQRKRIWSFLFKN